MSSDNLRNKTFKGVKSQTLIVALKGITGILYFSIMSHLLQPEVFGYFALLTAVTTILLSLSEAGFGSAIIQKKDPTKEYVSTAFTLSLSLGLFFSLSLFCCSDIVSKLLCGSDKLSISLRILSCIIFLQAINNITWAFYIKKLDFFKYGILQIISDVGAYTVGIVMAVKGYEVYSIVGGFVCQQLFLTIILILLKKYKFTLTVNKSDAKEIIGYGGWLTAAVITKNFTNQIDKIIIGRMLPIVDLGSLNRPQGFVDRISGNFYSIFDTVLFPIISSINDNKERVVSAYIKVMTLVLSISIILGSIISLASEYVIIIFFGKQWMSYQSILIIFAMSMFFHGISRICDSFFRSLAQVKTYFICRCINCVLMIGLVFVGCQWGVYGAAVGIACAVASGCLVKFFLQLRNLEIKFIDIIKTMIENNLFLIVLFVVCSLLYYTLPYGNILGISIYTVILILSVFLFPQIYGKIFNEIIINRFLSKLNRK